MALKLEWTPEAANTFDHIISYLESHWSEREVSKFIERAEKVLQLISENPDLYRRSESKSIHEAVITKQNTLYYEVREESIRLLTFWDNRQDPGKLKS